MSRNRGQCIIVKRNNNTPKLETYDENSDEEYYIDRIIIDNGKDNVARILDPSDLSKKGECLSFLKKPTASNSKKEYRSKQSKVLTY